MKNAVYNENSYYQGLIQNFYCAKSGCFCAFMNFFYQYNQARVFGVEHEKTFRKLFEYELENCKILSEILLKLGGDNKFYSSGKKFLSGFDADYTKNFAQIFLNDIERLEVNVIEVKNIICKIENLDARANLQKILENKQLQLKILRENYLKLKIIKKNS